MYDAFADAYDELFPVEPEAVDGLKALAAPGLPALDVGCAAGAHAIALADAGVPGVGIDPTAALLEKARARAMGHANPPEFLEGGMLDLPRLVPNRRFGLVYCLGNTLPHLGYRRELPEFLSACRAALEPGGGIAVELLNYRRLLRDKPSDLPLIDTPRWRFERFYLYMEETIVFSTILTDKRSGTASKGAVRLIPFLPSEVSGAMESAGFVMEALASDWNGGVFDPAESPVLLLRGRTPA